MNETTNNKTNFFSKLSALTSKTDLHITIKQTGDTITLLIVPKANDVNYSPLTMSGTIQELDNQFFEILNESITKQFAGIVSNTEEFIKQNKMIQDAEKKKKDELLNKKTAKKPVSTTSTTVPSDKEEENIDDDNDVKEDEEKASAPESPVVIQKPLF